MIKRSIFYFLLISQIVLAQDLNAPVKKPLPAGLALQITTKVTVNTKNDQSSNHAAMFAQRAFIKKDISVGDWQAVRKLNYSYFPSEKIIEIVQVSQSGSIRKYFYGHVSIFRKF